MSDIILSADIRLPAAAFIKTNYGEIDVSGIQVEAVLIRDKIDNSNIREIGAALYQETNDGNGAHILAIATVLDMRKLGVGTRIVETLQESYDCLTANILLTELNNVSFWINLGFKLSESNLDQKYIQICWREKKV